MELTNNLYKKILSRRNPIYIFVFLFITIIYFIFTLNVAKHYSYNATGFIFAGDPYTDPSHYPGMIIRPNHEEGYDGQFFYRFALNPFTNKADDLGIFLDATAYRQQRFVYPLLVWIFGQGSPYLTSVLMIIVNLISVQILTIISILIVEKFKLNPIFSLLIPLNLCFLFALSRDLCEIVEITMLLGGIYFLEEKKYGLSTLLLCLAVLTKETALIAVAGLLIYFLFTYSYKKNRKLFLYAIPILVFGIERIILTLNWGWNGMLLDQLLCSPFYCFSKFVVSILQLSSHRQVVFLIEILYIIIFLILVLVGIIKNHLFLPDKKSRDYKYVFAWILYLVLCFSLANNVWGEDYSYLRVTGELFVLGEIILLKNKNTKIIIIILLLALLMWLYISKNIVTTLYL